MACRNHGAGQNLLAFASSTFRARPVVALGLVVDDQ